MPGGMEGYGLNLSRGVSGAGGGRQGWVQTGCDPGVAQHQREICISVFSWLEDGLGMDGVAIEVCLKPTEDGPHGGETQILSQPTSQGQIPAPSTFPTPINPLCGVCKIPAATSLGFLCSVCWVGTRPGHHRGCSAVTFTCPM